MPALDNTPVPHPLLVEKVRAGETGAAAGRGFRDWRPGEAEARREEVAGLLAELPGGIGPGGTAPRAFACRREPACGGPPLAGEQPDGRKGTRMTDLTGKVALIHGPAAASAGRPPSGSRRPAPGSASPT